MNGYERRHGREAESEFSSAFYAAQEARYPRPKPEEPFKPNVRFDETFAQRLKRSKALLGQ